MNTTQTLRNNGTRGNFARSAICNALGFQLRRAAMTTKKETPVADAYEAAQLAEIYGENGTPLPVKLDLGELTEAYAAAFELLNRACRTPDAVTGKKPEHLRKWLQTPGQLVQEAVDYRLNNQLLQINATAALLHADPTARIEAVRAEITAQAEAALRPVQAAFFAALRVTQNMDDDALIDQALEALTNAGRDPAAEIKGAAKATIDKMRDNFNKGKFAAIDPEIWDLAGYSPAQDDDGAVTA